MIQPNHLEEAAKKIADLIPQGFGGFPDDLKDQIKALLAKSFEKMDLVSREEFDRQTAVLQKTRLKLEALEKRLDELENREI
ncbi:MULTISPECIES: accessory factor UbiK family protein [Thiomicrorhabdus]|uniref:Ubiquinone biosynthesis accessory factor UbiK n=1 Tax=Thiomicrorhabdus heinhorstiae TaxID=2748010 RepID=A0ABS0BUT7_9GAMM|nr:MULTISPECIES: accessory factor UbiK family protein [Thiomicrorhabdus]MBF6057535.1 accessory factor UbiK family protein [Thiomicrorhabdus heinhorstiae]